ncbi:23S rRNA (guanosine(2251)-2'-O)-methyltransferase RlmB [candidate division KSB1 bacterium]|nr:23S rRNA (guanosine(2251)-2'-O)-methyltransferase RlmB [candidate division KSB1 bacterium]
MTKPSCENIYGINAATEVVNSGRRKVHKAFLDRKRANDHRIRNLARLLDTKSISIEWVDKRRLTKLSSHTDHQGAVLRTLPYFYHPSEKLWDRPRILLLDSVEDPQNVGAILRSAEIFGFRAVLLSKKGVPDILPSIVKVSSGATEFLSIAKDSSSSNYANTAKQNGYQIVALDAKGTIEIQDLGRPLAQKVLLVIGGENRGVSKSVLSRSDFIVSICQSGRINSLNASVAAGIALFSLQNPVNASFGKSLPKKKKRPNC